MFTKMLVPLDGSEISEAIFPSVVSLAKGLDIPVVLVSVMDPGNPDVAHDVATPGVIRYQGRLPFLSYAADERYYTGVMTEPARLADPDIHSRYQYDYADQHVKEGKAEEMADLEKWLQQRAFWLAEQGVSVLEEKIITTRGKPSEGIIEFAAVHECDLIAMATHDRNILGQAIKGSVTNEVIRSSYVPVVAITPEKQGPSQGGAVALSSVAVPLDGSQFAESVLPYVENLASRLDLEVTLLQVLEFDEVFPPMGGTAVPPGETMPQMRTTPEDVAGTEAARYLESVAERLSNQGLRVRWDVISGDAAQDIAKITRRTPDTMIALASHSRSGVARWVAGSVAEELLRASGDPVLIISSHLAEDDHEDGHS